MYTRSQFGATKAIILGDPTLSFFPLLGIQMAPLLMTLVRKGKISSFTYHRVYAISLMMSYLALFFRLLAQPDKLLIVSLAFSSMFPLTSLRKNGVSRLMIWTFYAVFHFKFAPLLLQYFGMSSVVLMSAITVLMSGIDASEVSMKSRIIWVLFAVTGLLMKRICLSTDLSFETNHIEPIIFKLVPFMVFPPIVKQLQSYRCLFFDCDQTKLKKNENSSSSSNEDSWKNRNSESG